MSAMTPVLPVIPDFVAVIPAGGIGSRLWPLSQPDRPKFLLDLMGEGETMLQATAARLSPLASRIMVVTGSAHAAAVTEQLGAVDAGDVLAEPSPRDSMAAIALAAAVIEHRHGPRIMGSFAADHVIRNVDAFHAAVAAAVDVALTGKVVTIGIKPTAPSSAYGYIEAGAALTDSVRQVTAFTEKPDEVTAATMIATGRYVWNAGMFVVRTDVLLGHLERLQPALCEGVREIAAAWDTPERDATTSRVWPTLTRIAIDHAIAEPVAAIGGVAVVPADLGWYDVGDFDALAELLAGDDGEVVASGHRGPALALNSPGSIVIGGDMPVVVVGIPGAVIVQTAEALLVTTREHAQDVKSAGAALEAARDRTVAKP